MDDLTFLTPYGGVFGLVVALVIYLAIIRRGDGNDVMREIAERIHSGAMAFLRREYSILVVFVLVVAGLLAWRLHVYTAVCFVSGAICSARVNTSFRILSTWSALNRNSSKVASFSSLRFH